MRRRVPPADRQLRLRWVANRLPRGAGIHRDVAGRLEAQILRAGADPHGRGRPLAKSAVTRYAWCSAGPADVSPSFGFSSFSGRKSRVMVLA